MVVALFLVGGFCAVLGLCAFLESEGKFLACVGGVLLSWATIASISLDMDKVTEYVDVNIVDGVAVAVVDQEPINVNDRLESNFTEHNSIKVIRHQGKWSVGVWFPEFYTLELQEAKEC